MLNASDRRTKTMLEEKLAEALLSTNLFGERTVIFLDEVDGLAGRADLGAVEFIKDSVKKSQNPIVMAANDPESDEVRKLSSVATTLLFVRPPGPEVAGYLRRIAQMEGLEVTDDQLQEISDSSNGDFRAAVNSLQTGAPETRDVEMTASQSLEGFFDAVTDRAALKALRGYPRQPGEKVRELFASVTRSKMHDERKAMALDVLSRADVLVGRMVRGRNWRLLRYLDPLLSTELREALVDSGVHYTSEGLPWPVLLRVWNDSKKLKEMAGLVGRRTKTSTKGALVQDIPYLMVLCGREGFREDFVASLGLEENYAAFVAKEAARSLGAQPRER
jgi:replication factor C large subunit